VVVGVLVQYFEAKLVPAMPGIASPLQFQPDGQLKPLPQTGEVSAVCAGAAAGVFTVFVSGVVLQAAPENVTLQPYVQFVRIPHSPFVQSCFVFPSTQRDTVHCVADEAERVGVGAGVGAGVLHQYPAAKRYEYPFVPHKVLQVSVPVKSVPHPPGVGTTAGTGSAVEIFIGAFVGTLMLTVVPWHPLGTGRQLHRSPSGATLWGVPSTDGQSVPFIPHIPSVSYNPVQQTPSSGL
jgi:hypothetical protein